jgi:hypothetical protein
VHGRSRSGDEIKLWHYGSNLISKKTRGALESLTINRLSMVFRMKVPAVSSKCSSCDEESSDLRSTFVDKMTEDA